MASTNAIPTMLGVKIKIEAVKKELTLKEVTILLGIPHHTYMSMIINGVRPPGKYIFKIAKFLELTEEEVFALHFTPLMSEKKSQVS